MKQKYFLTFGQQYPSRDGWVTVYAETYKKAREAVINMFGQKWSMLYDETEFDDSYFPAGELAVINRGIDDRQTEKTT